MIDIIDKSPEELIEKSKAKKVKIYIKNTIIGFLIAINLILTVPNFEYYAAKISSDSKIAFVTNSDITQEKKILEVYKLGISNNRHLDDEEKKILIDAFEQELVKMLAPFSDEKFMKNIYAVASTERIHLAPDFVKKHCWWSGWYSSLFNRVEYENMDDLSLVAHEQMHAITKSNIFSTGLISKISYRKGYGINEGVTSYIGEKDDSYGIFQGYVHLLVELLGYNDVLTYYVNGDLSGLIKLLKNYISEDQADELIGLLDDLVFLEYEVSFIEKNFSFIEIDPLEQKIEQKQLKVIDIIRKLYEERNKIVDFSSVEIDCIEDSLFFLDPSPFEQSDYSKVYTTVEYAGLDQRMVKFWSMDTNGLFKIKVNRNIEYEDYLELVKYYSTLVNCDILSSFSTISSPTIIVNSVEFVVNQNDLNDISYEKKIEEIIKKLEDLPDVTITRPDTPSR